MRAAVLREDVDGLSVEEVGVDRPLHNEILIKTVASGLCHTDLHFIDGSWSTSLPIILGHEAAGVVQAVGEDVRGIGVGDHVITCLSVYCGDCANCLTGRSYLCEYREATALRDVDSDPRIIDSGEQPIGQFFGLGSFAEQMLVHQNAAVTISPEMPLDRAALIGCAVTTGFGAVTRTASVVPGSTVAVVGCGGIGVSAIQGAHIAGARTIIGVDLESTKLEWASRFGATHTVNAAENDPVAVVHEIAAGGVDYSFECVGLKSTAEQAYRMIRTGGVMTGIGMIPVGVDLEIPGADLFLGAKRIQGSRMGSNNFKADMPILCELYLNGRLNLDDMVTRTIDIDDINDGFAAMKSGETLRSVIDFSV